MKIDKLQYIDISEPIFNCTVYEGDTASTMTQVRDMSCGDEYNLTDVSMCLHNGTHIDAPSHFLSSGKTIDKLDLSLMCGSAQVVSADKIDEHFVPKSTRILIKDSVYGLERALYRLNYYDIVLIGVDCSSVGDAQVHRSLLAKDIVILENIVLKSVAEGVYNLLCLPINFNGCEASPVRAILLRND